MNIVIIDDEALVRSSIAAVIEESFDDIYIVDQVGSVTDAIDVLSKNKVDLIFLDVDIIGGSGFEVLEALKPAAFKVVFITAHQKYALQAIKFSAFDFILKPFKASEIVDAVNKARQFPVNQELAWQAFFNNISKESKKNKKIVLKTNESIHLVDIADIIRCEADNNYSTFYLLNAEKIVVSRGLKEYEDLLSNYGFFRVHQSHLINLNCVTRFDKKDGGFVVLNNKSSIPVSQRKRQKLLELFDSLE